MGHTRHATKGKINRANAHPFDFDTLVGAHNGTLTTQYKLDDYKDFDVDSENLFHHMEKNGVSDTTSKCGGAYALTWYDKVEKTLNFLRNDERTLFATFSEDMKTVFWASEAWMLEGILGRNKIKHGEIKIFAPYSHCSLDISFGTFGDVQPFDGFNQEEVTKYTPPVYKSKHKGKKQDESWRTHLLTDKEKANRNVIPMGSGLTEGYSKMCGKDVIFYTLGFSSKDGVEFIHARVEDDPTLKLRIFALKDSDLWNTLREAMGTFKGKVKRVTVNEGGYGLIDVRTIEVIEDVDEDDEDDKCLHGHNGQLLTLAEWEHATNKGCAWCTETPFATEHEELVWLSSHEHVCADCAAQEEVKQYIP